MFLHSDRSTISLQSCLWGTHQCLSQRQTDSALARAQQVAELIKCVSTADLQLPLRREGQGQALGSESWGHQGPGVPADTGTGTGKHGRLWTPSNS